MSGPTTPPAGLVLGAHCLPACLPAAGAPGNKPPHMQAPTPPQDPKAAQQHARHTHRHGGISLPCVPPRGSGAASSPVRLETAIAGSAQPSRVVQGQLRGPWAWSDHGGVDPNQTKPPSPKGGSSQPLVGGGGWRPEPKSRPPPPHARQQRITYFDRHRYFPGRGMLLCVPYKCAHNACPDKLSTGAGVIVQTVHRKGYIWEACQWVQTPSHTVRGYRGHCADRLPKGYAACPTCILSFLCMPMASRFHNNNPMYKVCSTINGCQMIVTLGGRRMMPCCTAYFYLPRRHECGSTSKPKPRAILEAGRGWWQAVVGAS